MVGLGLWDGSGINWTICKQSAPRSRQITTPTPHHLILAGRTLFLAPNQQSQNTEGGLLTETKHMPAWYQLSPAHVCLRQAVNTKPYNELYLIPLFAVGGVAQW